MIVVATEGAPPSLRGRLALWLVEARAGVYVGNYGARVRDMIWENVVAGVGGGNAVMAWASSREGGYDLRTFGLNRRSVTDLDGLLAISFEPEGRNLEEMIGTAVETNPPKTSDNNE